MASKEKGGKGPNTTALAKKLKRERAITSATNKAKVKARTTKKKAMTTATEAAKKADSLFGSLQSKARTGLTNARNKAGIGMTNSKRPVARPTATQRSRAYTNKLRADARRGAGKNKPTSRGKENY